MATPNGAVNSIVAHRAQRRVPHNALDAQLQVTADVRTTDLPPCKNLDVFTYNILSGMTITQWFAAGNYFLFCSIQFNVNY